MDRIVFEVTPDEAQTIVNALAEQPYRAVATLIPKLMSQAAAAGKENGPENGPQVTTGSSKSESAAPS